jgi:hypothetical protein
LRKYGDNAAEMGSERTPADFLDALLELTGEFRRVSRRTAASPSSWATRTAAAAGRAGTTTKAGCGTGSRSSTGSGSTHGKTRRRQGGVPEHARPGPGGGTEGRVQHGKGGGNGWPLAKSLTLIPTLYPASLAYGWNMLNPAHTFDRWRVRNVIVWARPNPPVGGDKVRPATSYITVACTSAKRWFDLDAVRTEPTKEPQRHLSQNDLRSGRTPTEKRGTNELGAYISDDIVSRSTPLAPRRSTGGKTTTPPGTPPSSSPHSPIRAPTTPPGPRSSPHA